MKKIYIIMGVLTMVAATGCKKFIDINYNPNSPTTVQEKLLLGPIEYNVAYSLAAGLTMNFMQLLSYNQAPPTFGTYQVNATNANSTWSTGYVSCLNNLKNLVTIAKANGNANYVAIAEVLQAYCLASLTDFYGDIPYSKALDPTNLTPTYDRQEDIYKAVQALLDQGIADMASNAGAKPGAEDFYYTGNMAEWKKLAYTLKARYYMHLTKAPGYTAAAQATLALTALQNGMTANTDDWQFAYPGGSTTSSRWWTLMQAQTTLIASSAIVDTLVNRNDPRLPILITKAVSDGAYRGRPIGTSVSGSLNSYSLIGFYTNVNSIQPILPYTEALFIKAEATLITSGIAAALPIYQSAVTANMTKLGVAATAQGIYMASRGSLGASYNGALERIIQEKRIADLISMENWNDWRRTGYPVLTLPLNALLTAVPRIIFYPQTEHDYNPQPQNQAARALTDRVWWDTTP
jgi:hypothetical protein